MGEGLVLDNEKIDIFLSRLNDDLTFQHAFEIYQDPRQLPFSQEVNVPFLANTAKMSAPDFGRVIEDDRLELIADENGSLAEVVTVSEHGEGKRYKDLGNLTKTIEAFVRQLDQGIAQKMKIIFVADKNLNAAEIERVRQTIQFKIKLVTNEEVTVPRLEFR